jgi:hypothetical protein
MPFQDQNFNLKIEGKIAFWGNRRLQLPINPSSELGRSRREI